MKKGILFVILAGIGWGTSCIFVNLLSPYGFSSSQMTATRLLTALCGLAVYCLLFHRSAFRIKPGDLFLVFLCGLCLLGTSAFYFESMRLTSASTSVVLMYLAPVPVMIGSVLFFGEKFHAKKGIAIGLMLVGCALVSGLIGSFRPYPLGVCMGFLAAASYTGYNLCTKLASRRGMDPFTTTLYTVFFAALCALLLCKPSELPALTARAPAFLIPLFFAHGIVTCLLPYLLFSLSLKTISVGVASAMSIVEPMTGAVLGFLIYDDPLSLPTVLGILLVIGSVFLLGMCEASHKSPNQSNHKEEPSCRES